jgi:hypothetical protein
LWFFSRLERRDWCNSLLAHWNWTCYLFHIIWSFYLRLKVTKVMACRKPWMWKHKIFSKKSESS